MKTTLIASAVMTTVLLASFGLAQQTRTDPWIGTWKLNIEKSKADPGPLPKSQTIRIEPVAGGAQKHTFDIVDAKGQTLHNERTTKYDGAPVAIEGSVLPPTTDAKVTQTFRRLDDRSFEVTNIVDGKPTVTTRVVVSPDGKTMTTSATGTDAQGRKVTNASVYEKQEHRSRNRHRGSRR